MSSLPRCPQCGHRRTWTLTRGRRRCAKCRYDWSPGRWPLRLTAAQWRGVVRWFVRGVPSAAIAHETGLDRKRVLRALTVIRTAIAREVPAPAPHRRTDLHSRSTPPVIGLRIIDGRDVWAELVPEPDADAFRTSVRRRRADTALELSQLARYAALVYRGRFHRVRGAPAHFGDVERFWGYLQQQLRAKGGVRPARRGLYLAEYSWRYNRRRILPAALRDELLALVRGHP